MLVSCGETHSYTLLLGRQNNITSMEGNLAISKTIYIWLPLGQHPRFLPWRYIFSNAKIHMHKSFIMVLLWLKTIRTNSKNPHMGNSLNKSWFICVTRVLCSYEKEQCELIVHYLQDTLIREKKRIYIHTPCLNDSPLSRSSPSPLTPLFSPCTLPHVLTSSPVPIRIHDSLYSHSVATFI